MSVLSVRRRHRLVARGLVWFAAGLAALGLAACGGSGTPSSHTYTIHGTVTLVGELPSDCRWNPGYMDDYWADLAEGTKFEVKSLSGTVLVTTALGAPKASVAECDWPFTARVPKAQFYEMKIPHAGDLVVPFSKLEKDHWVLRTTAH